MLPTSEPTPARLAPDGERPASWALRLKRWFGGGAPPAPPPVPEPDPRTPRPQALRHDEATLADYQLEHVVARTDRATVYRASERASGRAVALKTVRIGVGADVDRELWRERFLREAEASRRLEHEFIVRVHAGGVQGDGEALVGWLAMEWVQGTDLSRYAQPARLLPEGLVLAIAARVALALDHAHRNGVVHRDVKPANVLFDPTTGAVKVADFGSARVADTMATRSGLIMGTPAYMAPEQLAGADATPQCDLYALGVLLFELLTGRRPFEADSMGALLSRIAHQPPQSLHSLRPDLPPLLDDILGRLLAKKPGDRHANGRLAALELRLAQNACRPAVPGSVAALWVDTQPADLELLEAGRELREGAGDEARDTAATIGGRAAIQDGAAPIFRGTMADTHSNREPGIRRPLSSP
jgi:serine/threonine-protein kinase